VGRCDFDGKLSRRSKFSPHPKIDPLTGELFNFGIDLGLNGARMPAVLRCYRVDPAGRMSVIGKVALDHVVIQHDFAITERYLVFALAPITIAPVKALLAGIGMGSYGDTADYRPQQGMKIVLVPREGGANRVIECDPFVYVHVDNAYDDHGDVVLDLVRYESFELLSVDLKDFRDAGLPQFGSPSRLRITSTDRVLVENRDDVPSVEFPTHDERRTGREHRYTYFAQLGNAGECSIAKVDHLTGEQRSHRFTDGEFPGEPAFVPRSQTSAEDDGWLLSVTYLAQEHRTALVLLDANRIEDPPVATARIDGHFFTGFHGSFVPDLVSA
jgi:all-trans-8'-apo-beta-carotenal 15,15'-oxygenase